ncbi:MAG: divalent-cation tolerance protein CutA [Candidatus Omnitrophica bacterium]|nr:divalent-cation tolerance protein CutA [Candidatus Omnitrophota bacterium]
MKYSILLTTCPDKKTSSKIASVLVQNKLAACVTVLPLAESYYVWKGKREKAKEHLLLIKTRKILFSKVEKFILKNHPYDVPEIIAIPIENGSKSYLDWVNRSTVD